MAPFCFWSPRLAGSLLLSLLIGCGPGGQPYHPGPAQPDAPGSSAASRPADWAAYHLVPARVSAIPPDLLRQLRLAAGGDFTMASAGENFQAGCVVASGQATRRLCLLATTGPKWLLVYEQGGIAYRCHLIRCTLVNGRATAIRSCGVGSRPTTLAGLWAEGIDCPVGLKGTDL